jgi:hypothetical protein
MEVRVGGGGGCGSWTAHAPHQEEGAACWPAAGSLRQMAVEALLFSKTQVIKVNYGRHWGRRVHGVVGRRGDKKRVRAGVRTRVNCIVYKGMYEV